jgi:hypothetical protein
VKKSILSLFLAASVVFSQTAPAGVVATVSGKKFTGPELEDFVKGLPQQFQQFYQQDREGFLKQIAMLYKFSNLATAEKVDQQSPYKQRLEFLRLQTLAQGYVENYRTKITVTDDEVAKFYEGAKAITWSLAWV